ncbi:MAG: OmpA family protein [Alphaproteobacteria bacterium]
MNARDSLSGAGMRRRCAMLAAALAAAVVLSGCETMGDVGSALDPTDWFEDDTPATQTRAQADMRNRAEIEAARARDQRTPDVTTVPQRPPASTPASTRSRVTEGLVADRDNARYTDDAIRLQNIPVAGQPAPQQAAAPPPPAPAPMPQTTARTAPPAPPPPPAATTPVPAPPAPAAMQPAVPAAQQAAAVQARPAPPVPQLPGRTIEGQPVPSPGDPGVQQMAARPSVPATPAPPARPATPTAPMAAPAPAPMTAPMPTPAPMAAPAPAPAPMAAPAPQQMAALPQLNVRPSAARATARAVPAGPQQVAVIQFADNSAKLDANDRNVLRQVAELQRQTGSSVRIVGHASSRTRQLADPRHQQANLAMSQRRATAVAQALFEMGVTAQVVQIEAAADSQPLYSEAMPNGEAGNRRAEVFLVR